MVCCLTFNQPSVSPSTLKTQSRSRYMRAGGGCTICDARVNIYYIHLFYKMYEVAFVFVCVCLLSSIDDKQNLDGIRFYLIWMLPVYIMYEYMVWMMGKPSATLPLGSREWVQNIVGVATLSSHPETW